MPALAAVQAFGAKQRAARQAPALSEGSEAAVAEAAAALVELREMDAPEAKRGPMAEGGAAAAAQHDDCPTVASDRAHMAWQLRRLLLFDRRLVLPPFMDSQRVSPHAVGETQLCNAVCAATLVQGSVAGGSGTAEDEGEDAAWELEVLNGLQGPENVKESSSKHRRRFLAQAIRIGRGYEAPRARAQQRPAQTSSHAAEAGEALEPTMTAPPADGPSSLKYSRIADLTAFLSGHSGERCKERLGMSRSAMAAFVAGLPATLANHDTAGIKAISKALAARRNYNPPRVRDVFPNAPRELHAVVSVASGITLGNGKHLLVLQTLNGRPQYVSNGTYPSADLAFKAMCSELRDSKPSWLGKFGPGSVLLGPSITANATGKSPWCVAVCHDTTWRSTIMSPANDLRSLFLSKANTKGLSVTNATEPRFIALRGFLSIIGEYADVKYASLLRH